jgi:hypothetical protein
MLLVPQADRSELGCYIADVAALGAVPDSLYAEWLDLADEASEPNAFSEAWFVKPALSALALDCAIHIVTVRNANGRLAGIMPLTLDQRYGRIPAHHMVNWTHFQCFMGTPLVRRGDELGFWTALLILLDKFLGFSRAERFMARCRQLPPISAAPAPLFTGPGGPRWQATLNLRPISQLMSGRRSARNCAVLQSGCPIAEWWLSQPLPNPARLCPGATHFSRLRPAAGRVRKGPPLQICRKQPHFSGT